MHDPYGRGISIRFGFPSEINKDRNEDGHHIGFIVISASIIHIFFCFGLHNFFAVRHFLYCLGFSYTATFLYFGMDHVYSPAFKHLFFVVLVVQLLRSYAILADAMKLRKLYYAIMYDLKS